jgi:hypothetical protein
MSFQGFDLPDDLKMLSDTIAEFVRKEIVPVEANVPGDARAIPAADLAALQKKASIAKLYGTETGFAVVDAMMQILGGMGMTKDMPLEHWFRGLRVARVVERTERDPPVPHRPRHARRRGARARRMKLARGVPATSVQLGARGRVAAHTARARSLSPG